jgi:hypothetical protein
MNDDTKFLEPGALENILIGAYDTFVEENVGIRAKAGLTVSITREALGGCCEWCSKLAGTYPYGEEPKEIYQKHDNCTCMVTAKTDKGYTDVWSKKQYQSQKEARSARVNEILKEQKARAEARRKLLNQLGESDIITAGGKGSKTTVGIGIKNNKTLRSQVMREAINAERPIYAEDLRKAYKRSHIEKYDGLYDVVIHGTSYYVEYEHEYNLDAETLAWIISGRRDYKGNDIRLISCSTGKSGEDGNCFAQQLANKLRVSVYAPVDTVYIIQNKLVVKELGDGFPDGFRKFEPKKK